MGLVRTFFGMDIELLEIVRIGKEIGSAYYGDCANRVEIFTRNLCGLQDTPTLG